MIVKEYNLETSKSISNKVIAIASDIHISDNTSKKKLDKILMTLQSIKPTQIVIPGDLYNANCSKIFSIKNILGPFLKDASDIAKVFYVQGNAELKCSLSAICNDGSMKNFYGLYNNIKSMINIDDVNIAGLILPLNFYCNDEQTKYEMLLLKCAEYIKKISMKCNHCDFNILLCHDPIIASISELLQDFDLVISGHNHGGLFPERLKPLFKLVGANLDLLYPTYTKGMIKKGQTSFIVSEGITKFHSEFGPLEKLEKFHEGTIEVVKIKTIK